LEDLVSPHPVSPVDGRQLACAQAEALFENDEALFRFLDEELSTFGGIVSTETAHVLRIEKSTTTGSCQLVLISAASRPGSRSRAA
jgi:hypothetical protein